MGKSFAKEMKCDVLNVMGANESSFTHTDVNPLKPTEQLRCSYGALKRGIRPNVLILQTLWAEPNLINASDFTPPNGRCLKEIISLSLGLLLLPEISETSLDQ